MTTTEKLHEVKSAIRKALPRLMEVGEGCIIVWKKNNADYKIMVEQLHKYHLLSPRSGSLKPLLKVGIKDWEIIGKEPTLLDVLEWLKIIKPNIDFYINSDGYLKYSTYYNSLQLESGIGYINIQVDLSKPLLKDQSEELICLLYNLKKQ